MTHCNKNFGRRAMGLLSVLLLLVHLIVGISSCSSIDCPVQNRVELRCALNDTLKDTLTVWVHRSNGTDTILLNRGVQLTAFSLPVSYTLPVDTLLLGSEVLNVVDTVWVEKENSPHFESVDCGVTYFHKLLSVRSTHLGLDTVVINKTNVDYDPSTPHLLFYFKARP